MSQQQLQRIRLYNLLITILTVGGGVLFTIGSVVYLPTLSYINGNIGAVLFIVGSAFYFACDVLSAMIQPQFTPLQPLRNIGALRALLIAIGNVSFIVGSVYFLPALPSIVGDDIFAIASIFIEIPQILTFIGIYWKHQRYNEVFYKKIQTIKKEVVISTVMLAVACFLFFIGTILFKNKQSETIGLLYEGVVFFIVGSLLFLGASLVGAWVRHTPQAQYYRQQLLQIQSFRP